MQTLARTRRELLTALDPVGGFKDNRRMEFRSSSDEMRMKNFRERLERQHEIQVRALHERHKDEVMLVVEEGDDRVQQLKRDYEVRISDEANALLDSLGRIREENAKMLEREKAVGDIEVDRVKQINEARIVREEERGEEKVGKIKKDYEELISNLQDQAKKSIRKQEAYKT